MSLLKIEYVTCESILVDVTSACIKFSLVPGLFLPPVFDRCSMYAKIEGEGLGAGIVMCMRDVCR